MRIKLKYKSNKLQLRSAISISMVAPSVHIINPEEHNEQTYTNLSGLPVVFHNRWVLDSTGKNIYLLYGDAYQLDVLEFGIVYSNVPLIEANGRNFYGLAIHLQTGHIIVSVAVDHNQLGKIYTIKTNGMVLQVFNAAVIPGGFISY